jgi:membrane protease YdiL (CAAX protease family)
VSRDERRQTVEYRTALKSDATSIPQYGLTTILLIWGAAAIPMGVLGWVVAPALAPDPNRPGFERVAILTVGLAWQFMLVVLLLYREAGTLRWAEVSRRLWLNAPRDPRTGEKRGRLWLWLIPIVILTAAYQAQLFGALSRLWVSVFPFLAEPPGLSLGAALATPEARAGLVGAWGLWGLFVLQALFNTVIGEELLFRGLLLPRMAGAFGRWDWVANGLLFGLYHLHQPWNLLGSSVGGVFLYALPARYFRSSWFGIIAHSGQSVLFLILMLALVLGLA